MAEASRWDWVLAEMPVRLWGPRLLQGVPVKENSGLGARWALWSDRNAKLGTEEWRKCLERGTHLGEEAGETPAGALERKAQRWGRGLSRVTPEHGASRSKPQESPWAQRVRGGLGVEMLLCCKLAVRRVRAQFICVFRSINLYCNVGEARGALTLGPSPPGEGPGAGLSCL